MTELGHALGTTLVNPSATAVAGKQVAKRRDFLTSVLVVVATFAIYGVAALVRWTASVTLTTLWHQHQWLDQLLLKSVMAGLTVLALRMQRIGWREAGFSRPARRFGWIWIAFATIGLSLLVSLAFLMLRLPHRNDLGRLTVPQSLMLIGLCDPFVEEVFLRGWFQTSLGRVPGNTSKAAVLASACVFGLLHGFVYFRGVAGSTTLALIISTFLLGWIAARVRQKYNSLLPAVFVHVVYNVTGVCFGLAVWFILTHPKL